MNIGDDGMMLAADGAAVGIRSCGYFHGPDGECTYEKFAPAEYRIRECGACGFQWNYGTPADRCPMEAEHDEEDQDQGTLAWGPSAQREEPHPFTPAEGYSRWCAVCGYARDAYAHASEEERRAFDARKIDPEDALSQPCPACNAEPEEECRPGCIGFAVSGGDELRRAVDALHSAMMRDARREEPPYFDPDITAELVTQFLDAQGYDLSTPLDFASSASRQHYIDTGRYLRPGEAEEV